MSDNQQIIDNALKVIEIEQSAINKLRGQLNDNFAKAVQAIHVSKGRLIITGIGKSALIGQKIVATLNSTGTPSIFMHAADAVHGDLGVVQKDDIILCISYSGETPEIKLLISFLKRLNNEIIAIVGNVNSTLAKASNYILATKVEQEACPNNLAPTSSTTAQLVIGDALAVCLLEKKGFTQNDFAKYHPGGSLGKKLYLRVIDLCEENTKPTIDENADIKDVIIEITKSKLGLVVVTKKNSVVGIITDGDIRRMLQTDLDIKTKKARDIMSITPKKVEGEILAFDAVQIFKAHKVSQLLVMNNNNFEGVVHFHDFLREGIV